VYRHIRDRDFFTFMKHQQMHTMSLFAKSLGQEFHRNGCAPVLVKGLGGDKQDIQNGLFPQVHWLGHWYSANLAL
jgi:hypothetical protein